MSTGPPPERLGVGPGRSPFCPRCGELLRHGRERFTSPFHDFRLLRGVTWLEPTLTVDLNYSEVMEGRLRDPICRGVV